jgi:two-component system chemotaxis sensor kinase CheA
LSRDFLLPKKITNISGRGVGLDVVRKQIEKLNGSVSIWSEKGKGTKFTIKLPLDTSPSYRGFWSESRNRKSTPYLSLQSSTVIGYGLQRSKMIDNYEVFNVRKDVISILRLNRLFGIAKLRGV